jgi:CubicO group peptidase (beta-lactamase class C family)
MWKRILLAVTIVVLLVVAVGIGLIAANWPYVKRVAQLPKDPGEWPESYYQPVAVIDGGSGVFFPTASAEERSISDAALEAAASWAGEHNSVALLVLHRGKVQLERYWQGMTPTTLFSGRSMSRSLVGLVYGAAVRGGAIGLDDPCGKYLEEWRRDPRGRITIRELLQNTSGLEELSLNAIDVPPDASALRRWAIDLESLTSKSARLSLGTDFGKVALSFRLEHEPGTRFNFANSNPQILGVILERAEHTDYERWVEERLWKPIGAGRAEFYMDRENGMPAVYCCFRANPHDWLRVGSLLVNDGRYFDRQVLPAGWVAELSKGSRSNPLYGLQIWTGKAPAGLREYTPGSGQGVRHSAPFDAADTVWMEGGGGRTIWAIPSRELVIVRLGRASSTWDASMIPNTVVRGIRG